MALGVRFGARYGESERRGVRLRHALTALRCMPRGDDCECERAERSDDVRVRVRETQMRCVGPEVPRAGERMGVQRCRVL
jgi:hypothetical protein